MSRHSAQCTNRQNSTLAGLGGIPGAPELWRLRQEDSETMGKPRLVIYMRILHSQEKRTNLKTLLSGRRTTGFSLRNALKVQRQAQWPGGQGPREMRCTSEG